MPKIKGISPAYPAVICLLLALVVAGLPKWGFGKDMMIVETGNHHSASWQFTNELSELWQKTYPEMNLGMMPSHTGSVEKRFDNLLKKKSRFVIAPLTSAAQQITLNRPIKLVTLLWSVYLVPIDIGGKNEPIDLNNYRYWYIPGQSVIIAELMHALNKSFLADTIRAEYNERTAALRTSETSLFQGERNALDIREESSGPLTEALSAKPDKRSLIFQKSARIAGLKNFNTEILRVENRSIREIFSQYHEGILFYEMTGSIDNLELALGNKLVTTHFDQNIQDFLVSIHPWIQPVYKSRAGQKTLEFNMALFANANENSNFIVNILKLLSDPPKSYFPPSFIFGNLSIQRTKEISPIFIHAGSLKYFDLN